MELNELDEQFARSLGSGKIAQADAMIAEGYEAKIPALAKGLALACERLNIDGVKRALSFYNTDDDGENVRYHMYSDTYWHSGHHTRSRWVLAGDSAWNALIKTKAQPGDPKFEACAAELARSGYALGSLMEITQKNDGPRLIHQCAARGWLDFAQRIEKIQGQRVGVNPSRGDTPLTWALAAGRGPFAAWLVSKGAEGSDESVAAAVRGLRDPFVLAEGASAPLSWEDKALALRIGAKLSGLSAVVATEWPKTMAEPLESPGRLLAWLMIKAAHAQAAAGAPGLGRVELRARAIAEGQGQDWEKLQSRAEGKGMLAAFSKKARQAASDLREAFKAQAEKEVAAMEKREPPIGAALAHVDAGKLDEAAKDFGQIPHDSRLSACVAMLGLAKLGYWDMPMPQKDGQALQDRNPLRWAGFKLSLATCEREIDGPIPGLSGTTLAGLCAALGFEDALTELIDAGARLDPDELSQGPSPLGLALSNGRSRFAQVLIDSGASPMEGVRPSPFGYPARAWAIHLAFDQREERLIESMLAADPRSSKLPDSLGKTLLERSEELSASPIPGDAAFGAKFKSLAERALLADASQGPSSSARSRAL